MNRLRASASLTALVWTVLLLLLWAALVPVAPPLPTSDLYTHLSVARHLIEGDGFVNDVAVPVSFAFPFAARLPQPLIHRPPGFPLLLALPVAAAGDDPARAEAMVRILMLVLLALLAWTGARAAHQRGRGAAVAPWLALLLGSPLLAMTVGWGQVETPVALLLMVLWIRLGRDERAGAASPMRAAAIDALLAAAVALLRMDLFWLPVLWILARSRPCGRRLAVGLGIWAAVLAPWAIRNLLLTGHPFFTLQAFAEHLKQTADWPDYDIYRSLSPEPFLETLARDPHLVLSKFRLGLAYYISRVDEWLPWPLWAVAAVSLLRRLPGRSRLRPVAWLLVSFALMTLEYAPLSHTLRYMAVLLPVLGWEIWMEMDERLATLRPGLGATARGAVLLGCAVAILALTPPRLGGWDAGRTEALEARAALPAAVAAAKALPPGPIFTDSPAVLWHARRCGVWSPLDRQVEKKLRETAPCLADAPVILQEAETITR